IQPGTFEHALHVLIDTEFDLAALAVRYINDDTWAPAYDPSVMLKIVLLAYSRGIIITRPAQSRYAMEAVLYGAQYRKAGASWVCAVKRRTKRLCSCLFYP
ncbi:MAG: transposase, family, partial [Noviherbaspirillum sp.]|nr:transposase, family [Noviherbaspirillum sp.]